MKKKVEQDTLPILIPTTAGLLVMSHVLNRSTGDNEPRDSYSFNVDKMRRRCAPQERKSGAKMRHLVGNTHSEKIQRQISKSYDKRPLSVYCSAGAPSVLPAGASRTMQRQPGIFEVRILVRSHVSVGAINQGRGLRMRTTSDSERSHPPPQSRP